jgi:hypothetical protein
VVLAAERQVMHIQIDTLKHTLKTLGGKGYPREVGGRRRVNRRPS